MPNPVLETLTIDDTTYDLGGVGGGHVIEKSDGTDMTQRSNLQFIDSQVTDDSTNNRTKIENVKMIQNESELVNLPDGIYLGSDDETIPFPLEAEDITYDNTTSQLTATNVQAAIDELSQKEANKPALGSAAAKNSTNSVTAGSTDLVESGAVKTAIDNTLSNVYHHAGTKTCAELTSNLLIGINNGNVYNITDNGTTTADFMEGAGLPIRAGDNVSIAKISDSIYKFDLLGSIFNPLTYNDKVYKLGIDETGLYLYNITDGTKTYIQMITT